MIVGARSITRDFPMHLLSLAEFTGTKIDNHITSRVAGEGEEGSRLSPFLGARLC